MKAAKDRAGSYKSYPDLPPSTSKCVFQPLMIVGEGRDSTCADVTNYGQLLLDASKKIAVYRALLGLYRDHGKETGHYYIIIGLILGLYGDNGKVHGNC